MENIEKNIDRVHRKRGVLIAFTARLREDIVEKIKRTAKRMGLSQAQIVEDAVEAFLEYPCKK